MPTCSCPNCVSLCEKNPGWMTPEEALKAIASGHATRLMRAEPLNAITQEDVICEGFPDMTPVRFVAMLVAQNGVTPDRFFNRIEFEHI